MPFAQLVIQQITCRTPTETGINDHDEVYFLVAGATSSGKTVRVSPKGPAQDYFSMAAGDSLHEIVLWQDDLEDGKDAFLIVFVREQGKASGAVLDGAIDRFAVAMSTGRVVTAAAEKDSGELEGDALVGDRARRYVKLAEEFHSGDQVPSGVKDVGVATYGETIVVAVRDAHNLLQLIAWRFVPPEEPQSPVGPHLSPGLHRVGDSSTSPKRDEHRIRASAITCCGARFVTAIREDQTDQLRVIAWEATSDGSSSRKPAPAWSERMDLIADVSIAAIDDKRVVTGVRMRDGELELIVWDLVANGKRVDRRDQSSPPTPRAVDGLSITTLGADIMLNEELAPAQVAIAAVRQANGKLRVMTWDLSANGLLRRMTDVDFDPVHQVALTSLGEGTWTTSVSRESTPQYGLIAAVRDDHDELRLFGWRAAHDN